MHTGDLVVLMHKIASAKKFGKYSTNFLALSRFRLVFLMCAKAKKKNKKPLI